MALASWNMNRNVSPFKFPFEHFQRNAITIFELFLIIQNNKHGNDDKIVAFIQKCAKFAPVFDENTRKSTPIFLALMWWIFDCRIKEKSNMESASEFHGEKVLRKAWSTLKISY